MVDITDIPGDELQDLTAATELNVTDLFYLVNDPTGTPTPLKAALSLLDGRYLRQGGEQVNNIGDFGGGAQAIAVDDGNVVDITISTATCTISFTDPTGVPAGYEWTALLYVTNGGSQTVNWTNGVWAGGSAPTLTSSGIDRIVASGRVGGSTVYLDLIGADYS